MVEPRRARPDAQLDAQADTVLLQATPQAPVLVDGAALIERMDGPRYAQGALLGAGGMGEVHATVDRRIGREVAMKVLHRGASTLGVEGRRRFVREARIQGQLEHPGIVPVYDLEIDPDGETRLFMKRLRGVTLEAVITGLARGDVEIARRFPRRRLLTAFVSVCRAVDYAHARGVIHRDLKPSNIMLGEFGEVQVLDWGIAKVRASSELDVGDAPLIDASLRDTVQAEGPRISDGSGPTEHGSLLGTPGFMAPEQARGDVAQVDARSDVFALGAVLFELLTLEPLILGATATSRLAATLALDAERSPAARGPTREVPPELDVACVQATMPAAADRTASAGELAEAVDRYLDGDRDVALRRALAEEQVTLARRALDDREAPAESRARAVTLLAKALALDPRHRAASDELGRLLLDAPGELPREAAAELAAVRSRTNRTAAQAGLLRATSVIALLTGGALLGIRRPSLAALAIGGLLVAIVSTALWLHATTERTRALFRITTALSSMVALTTLSYIFGPTILVPAITLANALIILGQSDFKLDRFLLGTALVPVGWTFALHVLGVAPPPYQVSLDQIVIPSNLVSFPPLPTLVFLFLISIAQVLVPLTVVATLRAKLRTVEERLFLHSWHLRRWTNVDGG